MIQNHFHQFLKGIILGALSARKPLDQVRIVLLEQLDEILLLFFRQRFEPACRVVSATDSDFFPL